MNELKRVLRILSLILLAASLAIPFSSCGANGDAETTDTSAATTEITVELEPTETEEAPPAFLNPLTGLESGYDVSHSRPVGVMINNIYDALPQVGVGKADIIVECLAEGGITRLFALFAEYRDLGVIGSVRSSRPYYIDFAQTFDAIYVHAGGSEDAYSDLANRGINNIDGARGDPLGIYYRDETRMQTMAIEHTLMTTGDGIVRTIDYCGYRTDLRDGFSYPFNFCEWGKTYSTGGEECRGIHIPFSYYQTVDFEYDEENDVYLRYQYDGMPHIDGGTGEQLSFKNVLVLFCTTYVYDDYGRLRVETVGDGDGYLATGGTYVPIKWHRDSADGNAVFTRADTGDVITLNRGKTFINVCPTDISDSVEMIP